MQGILVKSWPDALRTLHTTDLGDCEAKAINLTSLTLELAFADHVETLHEWFPSLRHVTLHIDEPDELDMRRLSTLETLRIRATEGSVPELMQEEEWALRLDGLANLHTLTIEHGLGVELPDDQT
jgi:hypothetical protein